MTTINVGDRVRITRRVGEYRTRTDGGGQIGTVVRKRPAGAYSERTVYSVRPEDNGPAISAYDVIPAPKPAPLTMTPEPKFLVDEKRVQAAAMATEILGKGAELDKLIGLAEFILAAPTTGRMAVNRPPLQATPRPGFGTTVHAAAEAYDQNIARLRDRLTVDTSKDFEARDFWGDLLTVRKSDDRDYTARITTTAGHSVYLKSEQRDALVSYLNAL